MFSWMTKRFRKKSVDIGVLLDSFYSKDGIGRSYASFVNEGYKKNLIIYRAIRMLATTAASVPWQVLKKTGNGPKDREPVPEDHILNRLVNKPNEKTGHGAFFEKLIAHLFIGGQAFPLRAMGGGLPRYLFLLRPDLVSKKNENDSESDWLYRPTGKPVETYAYADVRPLRLLDPLDDEKGLSPLQPAALTIDQANTARKWNLSLLRKDARPSGLLKSKMYVPPELQKEILEQFMSRVSGEGNAGTPIFLKGDLDWQATGLSPAEMGWIDGTRIADRHNSVGIGVPPQLLGDKDAATYANYIEARRSLYVETILPLLYWIRDEFNAWLAEPFFPGYAYDLDLKNVEALQPNRTEEWTRVGNADWMTVNEHRSATDMEEVPGGNVIFSKSGAVLLEDGRLLIPAGLIPVESAFDEADEEEEIPAQQPPVPPDPNQKPNAPSDDEAGEEEPGKSFDELSPFVLRTKAAKVSFFHVMNRQRQKFIQTARIAVQRQFRKEKELVKKLVAAGATEETMRVHLASRREEWAKMYEKVWFNTGAWFARRTIDALPKEYGILAEEKARREVFQVGIGANVTGAQVTDLWSGRVAAFLREQAGSKIAGIEQWTIKKVQSALAQGVADGEGLTTLMARIDRLYLDQIIPNRSEVIARTEVAAASNAGSDFAAGLTGIKMEKEWITVVDGRERDSHYEMNEEKVPMDEPFIVGESQSKLMFPGDISQNPAPEEVINCRCVCGYIPVEE